MKRIVLAILVLLTAVLSGVPACSDLLYPGCGGLFTACDGDSPCCAGYVCDTDGLCKRPPG